MIGYSTIFARRTCDVNDVFKSSRLSKMKEAYEKLHCQCPAVVKDTLRWMPASFQDACRKDYAGKACRDFVTFEKAHLFKNDAACRALKNVLKYGGFTATETMSSVLIRFDTILSDTIN